MRDGEVVEAVLIEEEKQRFLDVTNDRQAANSILAMAMREAYELLRDVQAREDVLWLSLQARGIIPKLSEEFMYTFDRVSGEIRRVHRSKKDW